MCQEGPCSFAVGTCIDASKDGDDDGVPDELDNCAQDANPGQTDGDGDGLGMRAMRMTMATVFQMLTIIALAKAADDTTDTDADGVGDFCDTDDDGDGVLMQDNCPDLQYRTTRYRR